MSTHHQKKLGQNFLATSSIAKQIIEAAAISKGDTVIEIGPGKGALTFLIAKRARWLIAIEKDRALSNDLEEEVRRRGIKNTAILERDARDTAFSDCANGEAYILVGNIPYYLTAYLFRKVFESEKILPQKIVFMVQKEVAERIVSDVPHHTLLSVSIQAFGTSAIALSVSREHFSPSPKVDSVVVVVSGISRERFERAKVTAKKFFEVVRAGFRQPRKLLISNLSAFEIDRRDLKKIFDTLSINEKARASELSVDQWFFLAEEIKKIENRK